MLQVEPPEGCRPLVEPTSAIPEWILVLRARLTWERAAMIVILTAAVAVLVIVMIPAIAGRIG